LRDKQPIGFQEGQSVDLVIGEQTDLGYNALINNSQRGMLYKNEVFQPLRKGQQIRGFIKKVRNDGKIDLCLLKPGYEKVNEVSVKIIDKLRASGGFVSVTDTSPPEIIYGLFGVSKKTYKKAIGSLYKKRLIMIDKEGIKLIKG
jgi:predicted RNA-binding protein (virulence factor B family)